MTTLTSSPPIASSSAGPSFLPVTPTISSRHPSPKGFDVVTAYQKALQDQDVPHPIAAILALVELMESSTASTISGLAIGLTHGRQRLIDTQMSLGVRAGCQLWERFFALSGGGEVLKDFLAYKRSLIAQGKAFCAITAPQCRDKIAALTVDFLRDDCVVLTHSFSRTVVSSILRAHKQHKRIKVYVTEARPSCQGMRTYKILTAAGVPCEVVLDSAVAYVMERVDMVLVGAEAVVESGGVVSSVGTYQMALIAKSMQKPFYALAESYKFLRHYPLSQTDLPMPRLASSSGQAARTPLSFPASVPARAGPIPPSKAEPDNPPNPSVRAASPLGERLSPTLPTIPIAEMTREMIDSNPMVDITTSDLIDFIITDLGAPLSPTSVSQYLVAQFSS